MNKFDVDFSELKDLLNNLVEDIESLVNIVEDRSFLLSLEDVVATDVQEVFASQGSSSGFSWPSGITGVDTGDLRDSWTVGNIDVSVVGDSLLFSTNIHDDYGVYFEDRYGYLSIDDNPSLVYVLSNWIEENLSLKWEVS